MGVLYVFDEWIDGKFIKIEEMCQRIVEDVKLRLGYNIEKFESQEMDFQERKIIIDV